MIAISCKRIQLGLKRIAGEKGNRTMYRILLVEDDILLRDTTKCILEMEPQYQVTAVGSCGEARSRDFCRQDLFILDIGLPDGNGIDLCREIRAVSNRPILMLTAYEDEERVLRSFQEGADDYVTKPFRSAELQARLRALLRRSGTVGKPVGFRSGDLRVSAEVCEVFREEEPMAQFNPMEIRLLQMLMRRHGRMVSRESIGQALWSENREDVSDNTLTVMVSRLRRKLEQIGCRRAIETCWGYGYRWRIPVEDIYQKDEA